MKKILASIIIAMMLISVGVNVFADETKVQNKQHKQRVNQLQKTQV